MIELYLHSSLYHYENNIWDLKQNPSSIRERYRGGVIIGLLADAAVRLWVHVLAACTRDARQDTWEVVRPLTVRAYKTHLVIQL